MKTFKVEHSEQSSHWLKSKENKGKKVNKRIKLLPYLSHTESLNYTKTGQKQGGLLHLVLVCCADEKDGNTRMAKI